jgi:hypothetical protein
MSPSEVIFFLLLVGGIGLLVRFCCVRPRPHPPTPSSSLRLEEERLKRLALFQEEQAKIVEDLRIESAKYRTASDAFIKKENKKGATAFAGLSFAKQWAALVKAIKLVLMIRENHRTALNNWDRITTDH